MSTGFTIRPAAASDLDAAARLRARAWQESFGGFLPDAMLDGFVDSDWTRLVADEWRDALARGEVLWLAEDADGVLVGIAQAETDDAPDAPAPVRLSKLYLLGDAKGSGLSDALLECAIGDGPAYLWVLQPNTRAQRFYARHGFVVDGESMALQDDLSHVNEIRMVRSGRPR